MAPVINSSVAINFPQRKSLRSSSLSTPKKKVIQEEILTPKTEVKKQSSTRNSRPKIPDSSLRKVSQSPVKGSPIKKNSSVSSPLKCIRKVAQSPVKGSPTKKNSSVTSPLKSIRKVTQSPLKGSPVKKTSSVSSPLKSIQNSPRKNQIKQALFEESPKTKKNLVLHKTNSHWLRAQDALSSSIPDEIIGRGKQINILRDFLDRNLGDSKPSKKSKNMKKRSIYISGVPGTGKTTSLKILLAERPVDNTRVVFVNCMTIRRSDDIFKKLADAICPQKSYSDSRAAKLILEEEVQKSKSKILLVLDEVDQLDSQGIH